MRKAILIICISICCLIFLNFTCNKKINYANIKKVHWEDINKIFLEPKLIILTVEIMNEFADKEFIKKNEIFPGDERSILNKYEDEVLLKTSLDEDGFPHIYMNDEIIFPTVNAFSIGNGEYKALVYNPLENQLYTVGSNYSLYEFDTSNNILRTILRMSGENNKYNELRFINLKGECVFTAGWVNEVAHGVAEYSYLKFYKYNLMEKEVEIFDSYNLGIITSGVSELEEFYPVYDISKGQRFFYIPARNDREYTNAETFKREKVKLNGGLYVYDWWENKLFKLAEGNVVDVTNNTEDGYVYYKVMKREDRKRVYEYYRFRNPEEMLRKH